MICDGAMRRAHRKLLPAGHAASLSSLKIASQIVVIDCDMAIRRLLVGVSIANL
jgi:hypothetical protein